MAAILRVKDENGNIVSIPAIKGDKGEKGDPGEKGEKGERGAPGTVDGLPSGGYKGQSLVKSGDGNGEVEWGGDGLEYDSVMTIPMFVQNGKTQYIKIAVDKNPPYAQYYPITQISEGAELVPAVDYADGYALGCAAFYALFGISFSTLDSLISYAETIKKNLELLISGGYITNPIGLRYSNIDGTGTGLELSILKDCRVYYNKMSERAVLMLSDEYRYAELYYYYDEADITDYWKTNYYVSGHWMLYNSYSKRGEKYNVQPASSAGYLLGCNSNGVPKYTSPTDLNLLQFTEQTLTTEQQSQALSNIGGLSKNQGTANSGKFLGIGADGIVVPTEVSGGGGSDRLIAKYVHSGNPVIQPTSLDLETGVFTCVGHGLTTGDHVMVIPDGPFTAIPFELCSKLMNSTQTLSVRVVNDDTFVIRDVDNTDIAYPSTANTSVDVTKWHIEKSSVRIYTIDGFSASEIKVLMSGFAWGTSNFYPFVFAKDSNGIVGARYNNNIGGTNGNDCMVTPFYDIEFTFSNKVKMDIMYLNSPTTEADYKYLQSYPQFMGYNSRSKGKTTSQMYALRNHAAFTAITIMSSINSNLLNLMLANDFTVEVYKLG